MSDYTNVENKHTSGVYAKHGVSLARGLGALVWDNAGKEYIDCIAGHGTANLGHCHPEVVQAISEQAGVLIACPESFYNDRRAELQAVLGGLVPGLERIFFCNSGTEAVEGALKFARISTGRNQVVAAMRGFHGRTMGALSATWNKKYREPFEPLVPGFRHVPFNDIEALTQAVNGETAAVLLEVIQGEGGVHPASPDYLQAARELCSQHGALLIFDEIQTGFGRTGKMFAFEHNQIIPDLLCLAKSIAGGLPMGAILLGEVVKNLTPGVHGSTFGGNPLACAAALAVLQVMERDHLAEQALEKGTHFMTCLDQIQSPLIREIRGRGLMVGIELKQKVAPFLSALEEQGVLALPAGLTVIRLLPPLVISLPQLEGVAAALNEVLT